MQMIFAAPSLTPPTQETLEQYSTKRFRKIARLLTRHNNYILRISADKQREDFYVTADLSPDGIVTTANAKDLRKAIDLAADQLKRLLTKEKGKRSDISRKRKVKEYIRKVTDIF
jgi:ribosomal subunit interface protein